MINPRIGQPVNNKATGAIVSTAIEDGWKIVQDDFGDWRAINERAGLRTRLMFSLFYARQAIADRRFQRRQPDGTWIDRLDREMWKAV